MIKVLTAAALFLLLLYPPVCHASYLIHLKDGREFSTDRYWEEGDQIKFRRYGGVIGIQKDLVRGIEEKKDLPEKADDHPPRVPAGKKETASEETGAGPGPEPSKEVRVEERPEKAAVPGGEDASTSTVEEAEEDEVEKEADQEARLKARKMALSQKIRKALEAYRRAKRAGDREKMDEEFRRVSEISGELEDLEKEVKEKNGGLLPDWWQ
ncbi:MAG: hypothetical protein JRJ09_05675 [Deltaproteobacteria bacterium]|nr:hypothetical protein [Deltaproteobacteria bacterium]MBW2048005.1 hypothetical protein [Deltaproteobacteria bacterium]MBW2111380.1 hypothetical protein [Deltaproteobacteria bacterium]MBW2353961.1 hypothetical protein [Deltaproteobacteria bacterium]